MTLSELVETLICDEDTKIPETEFVRVVEAIIRQYRQPKTLARIKKLVDEQYHYEQS